MRVIRFFVILTTASSLAACGNNSLGDAIGNFFPTGGGGSQNMYTILRQMDEDATIAAAESQAQLDATIAAANAQAARERREEEREQERQQEKQQADARDALARTLGEANAIRSQQMAEAKATGNVAAQQKISGYAQQSAQIAQEYGIQDKVSQKEAEYQAKLAEYDRAVEEREAAIRRAAEQEAANKRQLAESHARAAAAEEQYRQQLAENNLKQQQYQAAIASRNAQLANAAPADPLVEFREGITLCQPIGGSSKESRCYGPLQMTIVQVRNLDDPATRGNVGMACGSDSSLRDLGMVSGFRAFGCGFGINPNPQMADYPGNNDVPKRFGVGYISGQQVYRCKASKEAYCRGG